MTFRSEKETADGTQINETQPECSPFVIINDWTVNDLDSYHISPFHSLLLIHRDHGKIPYITGVATASAID